MNRTPSETAKILGVKVDQVKRWAFLFQEHLSAAANPPNGETRIFSDDDVLALSYVCSLWEEEPDIEAIKLGLNLDEHFDDRFRTHLYAQTPLLQDPPEGLDETWTHGVFFNGAWGTEFLELARSYRGMADSMLTSAIERQEAVDSAHPILFAYRHTLELYLKIIGETDEPTHSLRRCLQLVEKRFDGKKVREPERGWILEMDSIDPFGTAFRYADETSITGKYDELWLDLVHLKFAMTKVFDVLDHSILHFGCSGKPAKKKMNGSKRNQTIQHPTG